MDDRSYQNQISRLPKPLSGQQPLVTIDSVITSACGKYNGTLYYGTLSATGQAGDDNTFPGNLTAGASCVVVNINESTDQGNQAGTHSLAVGSWLSVRALGKTKNTATGGAASNAKIEAMVSGGNGGTAFVTPVDPVSVTADTTTWTQGQKPNVPGDGPGFVIYLQTRSYWDSTGGVLYMYQRKFTFDGRGMLYKVGAEERVTVDSPTACA